jgi:hypothetical protein
LDEELIGGMKGFLKIKSTIIEATKECRTYAFSYNAKRQPVRIIESIGMNPMDKLHLKRNRISNDPNIVYFDIDCSDKYGGARDIVEIKVNKSPPLLLNTRQLSHYQL